MARALVFGLLVSACASEPPPQLLLEGSLDVRVDTLGRVTGPRAVISDGTPSSEIRWEVSPDDVARFDVNREHLLAIGPGEAEVMGQWRGQQVSWTLVVEPIIFLHFHEPPADLSVGETTHVMVLGRVQSDLVDPGVVRWATSDPDLATVDAMGRVTGRQQGIVYITASGTHSDAMLELVVN